MKVVTSYINPDLDGVACAIGYSRYLSTRHFQPRFVGALNAETICVLGRLSIASSLLLDPADLLSIDEVVLVDCHHPSQLPHVTDLDLVTEIIDHHPDGQPSAFARATVQNEVVGAAATLVAEHVESRSSAGVTALRAEDAALLACAIASNTLDFAAPSTTKRDKEMFNLLLEVASPQIAMTDLLADMRRSRLTFLQQPTEDAVRQDVKIVEGEIGKLAVSQLEGDGASQLLDRPDLLAAVQALAERADLAGSLLSLVDTAAGTTTLISGNERILSAVRALPHKTIDEFTVQLPLIALRKTHIIPALRSAPNSAGAPT